MNKIFLVINKDDGTLIDFYKENWGLNEITEDTIAGQVTSHASYMSYFQKKLKSIIISTGGSYYTFFFFEKEIGILKKTTIITMIGIEGLGVLQNREDIKEKIESINLIYRLKQPYEVVDEFNKQQLIDMIKLKKLNKNFIKTGIDMTARYIHQYLRDIDKDVILSILSNVIKKDNDDATRQQVLNKLCELIDVPKNSLKDILSVFISLRNMCTEIAGLDSGDENIKAYIEFEHKGTEFIIGVGLSEI